MKQTLEATVQRTVPTVHSLMVPMTSDHLCMMYENSKGGVWKTRILGWYLHLLEV